MATVVKSERVVYSETELVAAVQASMVDDKFNELIIMCGHFMLFYSPHERRLVPGILEEIEDDNLRQAVSDRVGIFPLYTWDLGIRIGEHYKATFEKPVKILLLINDWQYVPDQGEAGDYRGAFYDSFAQLPSLYSSRLQASTYLREQDILPSRRHNLAFPETWLRYRFQNAAKRLVKQGKLQKRYLLDKPGQSEVSFTDESGTSLPLISCGITGCAGEITEMISEVHRSGGRYLLILAPAECHAPIQAGVEIALSIYDLSGMMVLVADTGGSGEATVDHIFRNGVSLATFVS